MARYRGHAPLIRAGLTSCGRPATNPGGSDNAAGATLDAMTEAIRLDGAHLSCIDVACVARAGVPIAVDESARDRVAATRTAALDVARRRPVYGLSTGVGANNDVTVGDADMAEHGMRLIRSHAACIGPVEADATVRATLAIRLNQLLVGHSSVGTEVVDALTAALTTGSLPTVHRYGALGTADLSSLAEIGLTLAGELPWRSGGVAPVRFAAGEALAFLSSGALTLATATLAGLDLAELLDASLMVAALSFRALGGNAEAYAEEVHAARPHPGSVRVAAALRRLLGTPEPARHVQDPYALRTLPQVHGAAVAALGRLSDVLEVEINAGVENPFVVIADASVLHHGQFHAAELATALDSMRPAIASAAALSTRRTSALLEPDLTGLPTFLASGPPGSSGVLILEYVAQDVLAEMRHAAAPVAGASVVISRGVEDHASFASQAARNAAQLAALLPTVLGCELVAAVRALRAAPERLGDGPVRAAYERAAAALPHDPTDRPLGDDLATAISLLPEFAQPMA